MRQVLMESIEANPLDHSHNTSGRKKPEMIKGSSRSHLAEQTRASVIRRHSMDSEPGLILGSPDETPPDPLIKAQSSLPFCTTKEESSLAQVFLFSKLSKMRGGAAQTRVPPIPPPPARLVRICR